MPATKQYVDLDFQSVSRILNIPDAANPTDPVTLQQLNNFLLGRRWKEPARVATTANLTLTAPGTTIDGVTMVSGDRVLVKNQTNAFDNGIYVWNGASSTMTRATDADAALEIAGATITVTEGTAGADKLYTQNADTITLGTTNLNWVIVGGQSVTAGNGLTGTTTISVLLDTASGLIVSGTGLKIDSSVVVRKFYKTNATGSSETVTHNLNNSAPQVILILLSTGEIIMAKVNIVDANNVTISYSASQTSGTIGIVVQA